MKPKAGMMLAGAVGVFIVASIVQAAGGSSMFSTSYAEQGFLMDLLMNLTFWPGWILTVSLLAGGVKELLATDE